MLNHDGYFSEKMLTYRIEVNGIASVYIACWAGSQLIQNLSFLDSDNDYISSEHLPFSLRKDFAYGGTRLGKYLGNKIESSKRAIKSVNFLALAESHIKHTIINRAIREGCLNKLIDPLTFKVLRELKAHNELQNDIEIGYKVPEEYLELNIKGARCIILPHSEQIESILKDINNPQFNEISEKIFKEIGKFLNGLETYDQIDLEGNILQKVALIKGNINLTPDFGRFAQIADLLNKFTPQVLCINAKAGGCSGKVAYTVTGILAGLEACIDNGLSNLDPETKVTFIGSAGALGAVILQHFKEINLLNVRVADLQYKLEKIFRINTASDLEQLKIKTYSIQDQDTFKVITLTNDILEVKINDQIIELVGGGYQVIPATWEVISSVEGKYTDEALNQKGIIIATTIGREIENSNYDLIPSGTLFIAAHNIALPLGREGLNIVNYLHGKGVFFVPGQPLTLGGALTSRLEACHRAFYKITKNDEGKNNVLFPKRLAHEIVREIVYYLIDAIIQNKNNSPWENLLEYSQLPELLELEDQTSGLNHKFIPYDMRF
ncbi:hypothetical protein NOVO_00960 [Rickettsiales bacterium Ac37b]|nr:hypothetical protein NOVO_00960 [Rickettsiales bacterium Ac37b]